MDKNINFVQLAEKFMVIYDDDKNSRFRSYDHVHDFFRNTIKDKNTSDEQLALSLFAFLASWGMLRGSGFLLQKDYFFLIPVIKIVREDKYQILMDVNPFEIDKSIFIDLIFELKNRIIAEWKDQKYWKYSKEERQDKKFTIKEVTDTQIGKILLAVFGCIPAYDRYIKASLRDFGISDKIDAEGLRQMLTYLKNNQTQVEEAVKVVNNRFNENKYSVMKVFDMITWEYGFDLEVEE